MGLNPYGLTWTLGLQGAGRPRGNPRGNGLERFIGIATGIGARVIEIHAPWPDAVALLVGPQARFIHGQVLRLDGGMTLFPR